VQWRFALNFDKILTIVAFSVLKKRNSVHFMLAVWFVVAALSMDPKQLKWAFERLVKGDGHLLTGKWPLDWAWDLVRCIMDQSGSSPDAKHLMYAAAYCVCKHNPISCSPIQTACKSYYDNEGGQKDKMSKDEKDIMDAVCKGVCSGSAERPSWCPLSTGAIVGIMIAVVVVVAVVVGLLVYCLVYRKKSGDALLYNT
jgi:NADH:ubiquinone oxidoreductase subunit K